MGNPVTSKSSFPKLIFDQCCCFFTLRTGTLIIGIFQLVIGIIWLIGGVSQGSSGFSGLITTAIMIASGVLIVLSLKKEEVKYLWWAIYINISLIIWFIIFIIIAFVSLFWALAIAAIINLLVLVYFTSVLRSYAFEFDQSTTTAPATTTGPNLA